MFMVSFRLSRKRMFLGALALVLVISIGVLWSGHARGKEDAIPAANQSADKKEGSKTENKKTKKIDTKKAAAKTNEQRVDFIESFGWTVEAEPAEIIEVIIPKEFDSVYKEYNAMQKLQGCDLSSNAGKRCKRYSYKVTNYPNQTENVRINLLVLNNKVIGGDVCSLDAGGFMHGFAYAQPETAEESKAENK